MCEKHNRLRGNRSNFKSEFVFNKDYIELNKVVLIINILIPKLLMTEHACHKVLVGEQFVFNCLQIRCANRGYVRHATIKI